MIREIAHEDPLYEQVKALRDAVLRQPLGLVLTPADIEGEEHQTVIAALEGNRVIGTVLLKPLAPPVIKLRQMAVAPPMQGIGLGARLVRFAEGLATERGYGVVALNARLDAKGFYEKLGYGIEGDVFLEVGIPHLAMRRRLPR